MRCKLGVDASRRSDTPTRQSRDAMALHSVRARVDDRHGSPQTGPRNDSPTPSPPSVNHASAWDSHVDLLRRQCEMLSLKTLGGITVSEKSWFKRWRVVRPLREGGQGQVSLVTTAEREAARQQG